MASGSGGMPGGILWAQIIGMMVLGMVFALALGWIFSDEPLTRFVSIGLIFGLSSIASVRKRHLASLMVFAGGLLWFLQIIVWDDIGWLSFVGWALVVAGLIVWALFSHSRGGGDAESDAEDGDRITGSSVMETSEDELHLRGAATNARRVVTSQAFRGGDVSVSLGALEIDLTSAGLAEDGASLALALRMGNITLRVPGEWVVEVNGSFKMGVVKDERSTQPTEGPMLRLNVDTSMGAVNIVD